MWPTLAFLGVVFALSVALPLIVVSVLAAAAEQLGWTGYATERLLGVRRTVLPTSVVVGSVWAVWHVPWMPARGRDPGWIAWARSGPSALGRSSCGSTHTAV